MGNRTETYGGQGGLGRWIPVLLRAWRRRREPSGSLPPDDTLSAAEKAALTNRLRALTRGLGATRTLAGSRYMDQPDLLGAYLLYFWPVSYAQVRYCLGEAGIGPGRKGLRGLDLGSGPGAASCALYDCGASTVVAADRSRAALALAAEIAREDGHALRTVPWDAERGEGVPAEGAPYDVVVCSHLLNELWTGQRDCIHRRIQLLRSAARHLSAAGVLVVVEPALRGVSRDLLAVRDGLAEGGLWVQAPCTMQAPCPALAEENATCHAAVDWRPPRLLDAIAEAAGPHREALKMSYVVVRTAPPQPSVHHERWRVVSDQLLNKAGRLRVLLCGPGGRRSLSTGRDDAWPAMKTFLGLRRGDLVRVSEPVARGEGWALGQSTAITVERPGPA